MVEGRPPPTAKKLPVEADMPEYICQLGGRNSASALEAAMGNLKIIAFYYFLHMDEYTCKHCRNTSKQKVQFKMEDVAFFTH